MDSNQSRAQHLRRAAKRSIETDYNVPGPSQGAVVEGPGFAKKGGQMRQGTIRMGAGSGLLEAITGSGTTASGVVGGAKRPRGRPRREGPKPLNRMEMERLGKTYAEEILKKDSRLSGSGLYDAFSKGFTNALGMTNTYTPPPVAPAVPSVLESGLEAVGVGKRRRRQAGPDDRRRKRAEVVKRVMAEKGLSMIEASKYVKQHNLF